MFKYLPNRYTAIYEAIIERARSRPRREGYYERHHVLPKSLGGNNCSTNLVYLTAKEHFLCHRLLTKMTTGESKRKMQFAAYMMTVASMRHARSSPSSRVYERLRLEMAQAMRERPGPNKGKRMSDEQRAKISATLKGRVLGVRTDETSRKLRAKTMSPAARAALAEAKRGVSWGGHSAETKQKMSERQKGVPKPKHVCENCGASVDLLNLKRWHGERCRRA